MRAERGRRRSDYRELARRTEPFAPSRPSVHDEVLALQRSAGNAAARLLQRQGWEDARVGGWNEAPRAVTGTQRIPVKGLKNGNQSEDPQRHTKESAKGRAIVARGP